MIRLEDVTVPSWLNVSRETIDSLHAFAALVAKWNPAINLVSKGSLPAIWDRHILDSAQIFLLVPSSARHLVDLGSGGGFPGLVVAILAQEAAPELRITLIESDQRKATFLGEGVRQLRLRADVVCQRILSIPPQNADVLTARALAPLSELCAHAHRHLSTGGCALFAKGAQAESEIEAAQKLWSFNVTRHPSRLEDQAAILAVSDVRHV